MVIIEVPSKTELIESVEVYSGPDHEMVEHSAMRLERNFPLSLLIYIMVLKSTSLCAT